jgi:hypothetical protein
MLVRKRLDHELQAATQTSLQPDSPSHDADNGQANLRGGTQTTTPRCENRILWCWYHRHDYTITNSKSFGGTQTVTTGPFINWSQRCPRVKGSRRLGRIRDAAERAALYRNYNRDLDRIKITRDGERASKPSQ